MPLSVHWFLPTAGDSRDVVGFGPTAARREASLDYLAQVAKAAEQVGFDAVLTPTGTWCEDAWVATAALLIRDDTPAVPRRLPARAPCRRRWRPSRP